MLFLSLIETRKDREIGEDRRKENKEGRMEGRKGRKGGREGGRKEGNRERCKSGSTLTKNDNEKNF